MIFLERGIRTLPSAMIGAVTRAGFLASLFFVLSATSVFAAVDPSTGDSCRESGGTCYASSVQVSGRQLCVGTDGEDSSCLICCSGEADEEEDESTSEETPNTSTAATGNQDGCTREYDSCQLPNGKWDGYCWEDDSTGFLSCHSDPVDTGGGITGGSGTQCRLATARANETALGSCQPASECRNGSGTEAGSPVCGSGQVCCRTLVGGGGGSGPGGTVGTGGGTPGAVAGLACRGYFCWPSQSGLSSMSISTIIVRVMNWLLIILGSIAIIAFVISGIQYLIAAGDEEMMEKGKNNMKYSIIGVIIALSGLVIVRAIDMALFGNPFF